MATNPPTQETHQIDTLRRLTASASDQRKMQLAIAMADRFGRYNFDPQHGTKKRRQPGIKTRDEAMPILAAMTNAAAAAMGCEPEEIAWSSPVPPRIKTALSAICVVAKDMKIARNDLFESFGTARHVSLDLAGRVYRKIGDTPEYQGIEAVVRKVAGGGGR